MSTKSNLMPFNYKGKTITFKKDGDVFVNATEMARPFGKRVVKWKEKKRTKDFLRSYLKVRKTDLRGLDDVIVTTYGNQGSTWFHEDIAMEFARWLSPEFSIWCNEKIKELLKHGVTATPKTMEDMINNPDFTIKILKELKKERKSKEVAIKRCRQLQPKADYMDRVIESDKTIDIGEASKILELPFGRNTLFKKLREKGIFFKNRNEPKQYYVKAGYFILKEKAIKRPGYPDKIWIKTLVTQKGLNWLNKQFPERNQKLPWN